VATRDERGALAIAGRRDDVITVSGHRLSPAAVESAALDHPAVGEAAAVGQPDETKTETIVLLVVLRPGFHLTDDLRTTIVDRVRAQVGPIAVVGDVVSIDALPKTRTGKVLRRTIRSVLVDDHPGSLPDAVDEDTVAEIRDAVDEADE
jgi:acetyl-CoA synthetase